MRPQLKVMLRIGGTIPKYHQRFLWNYMIHVLFVVSCITVDDGRHDELKIDVLFVYTKIQGWVTIL